MKFNSKYRLFVMKLSDQSNCAAAGNDLWLFVVFKVIVNVSVVRQNWTEDDQS